jgi:hypothetical protein
MTLAAALTRMARSARSSTCGRASVGDLAMVGGGGVGVEERFDHREH